MALRSSRTEYLFDIEYKSKKFPMSLIVEVDTFYDRKTHDWRFDTGRGQFKDDELTEILNYLDDYANKGNLKADNIFIKGSYE